MADHFLQEAHVIFEISDLTGCDIFGVDDLANIFELAFLQLAAVSVFSGRGCHISDP